METTARLLELQELDLAIDRLASRRRTIDEGQALMSARADADAAEHELGELRLRFDELDRDAGRFEHEIDSLDQKATAEQRRMSDGSVANARELEAIGREVQNLLRRKTDREDELLALMELREQLQQQASGLEARATELRAQVDLVATESGGELAQVQADLERKLAERAALAPAIDPDLLELYEDLRVHKRGVGAAALVDGVCQGCHEKLSSVERDRLKHGEGVKRCEYCRRILVL